MPRRARARCASSSPRAADPRLRRHAPVHFRRQRRDGTGDTTLLGNLILSRAFGAHDVHGSVGLELNADDPERTRARYALGVALQPAERLAFLVDLLGSSSFVDDEFTLPAPRRASFQALFGNDELVRSIGPKGLVVFVPRSDVVDVALGVKVNLLGTLVGFASAIVPVTRDGLRAELIPAAGVEWSF